MRKNGFTRLCFLLVAVFLTSCSDTSDGAKTIYGNIVDVVSRRIFPGKVLVHDGKITEIVEVEADERNDEKYILPGFVDSHIHIESTLMVPENYARMAVANGVLAAVCDPHEIANVLGMEGVEYMIENGKEVRFNFNYTVPSCVPSTQFETSGAELSPQDVAMLMGRDEVVALAEVMNVPDVVNGEANMAAKLQAAKDTGKPIDGHSPKITGKTLQQYVQAGISTEHECVSLEEAKEKLALGMKIIIREGSAACDFNTLYSLITEFAGMTMFCSDDMYPDDVESIGYINGMVKRAIANGMPLWETLETASVTPVRHYNLKNGLLQKGDPADFIIVDNLKEFNIRSAYVKGEEVYTSEKGIIEENFIISDRDTAGDLNNFEATKLAPEALQIKWEDKQLKVIVAAEGSLITGVEYVKPEQDTYGNIITDADGGINKIVVYNRYSQAEPQIAYIKGFGLKRGALASTIAHDSHNIIAVGSNDEDLAAAINLLIKEKGGISVCEGEKMEVLPLPVAGLMTNLLPDDVVDRHKTLKKFTAQLRCPINAPFMTLAFMALPVIPALKLTDKGLFDGVSFGFTTIWKD